MNLNRREFIVLPAAAMIVPSLLAAQPTLPWQRKLRRVGQTNMTEHDPAVLDVEQWADYWASLKVDAVLVSVTGILAFYPTKVPLHRRGKFLGDRDFFGECCTAAKKRGLHVIARMSPDLNWEDALRAHPEWFRRDAQGNAIRHVQDPRLYHTCMFTSYMTDYIPAIMREVNARYDVDALYTNAFPEGLVLPGYASALTPGATTSCHCEQCKGMPARGTIDFWEKYNERTIYLWELYNSIAKEKNAGNFYFANLGGDVSCPVDLIKLGEICDWFQCDNQGRGGDATPIWGCALQGRVCNAVQQGKSAANVNGGYSTTTPVWRNAAKSPQEQRMWFNETIASGMAPYHHLIGGEDGMGEDRRWLEPAHQYFDWMAKHDAHFTNRESIANLGVVMGQRTHLFYKPPQGAFAREYLDGMYYALLEGRFLFDFVHEDKLTPENLAKYAALLLPNIALLSDKQCSQLRAYVDGGGSLLATFETSLYTERNQRRPDLGLADVFGIQGTGDALGTNGNAYLARIERSHEVLHSFSGTHWLPGAEYRLPMGQVKDPILTVVPGYPSYPPELSYPAPTRTNEPAIVLREKANSRLAYFPGDIERTLWRSGNTDLTRLLQNTIRWVAGTARPPVSIEGAGIIESFAWETRAGFAVHVLNYTNPAMHRGWIREFYPIGDQKVRMSLPAGRRVTRVELLCAGKDIPFSGGRDSIEFTIPGVLDYEVAALHST
jgi:Hypothetical glycosyl hydrolase 6/Beta-galactosidase trimerisation domain